MHRDEDRHPAPRRADDLRELRRVSGRGAPDARGREPDGRGPCGRAHDVAPRLRALPRRPRGRSRDPVVPRRARRDRCGDVLRPTSSTRTSCRARWLALGKGAGTQVALTGYNNVTDPHNLFNQTDVSGTAATGTVRHGPAHAIRRDGVWAPGHRQLLPDGLLRQQFGDLAQRRARARIGLRAGPGRARRAVAGGARPSPRPLRSARRQPSHGRDAAARRPAGLATRGAGLQGGRATLALLDV